jgi:hypothetical protein
MPETRYGGRDDVSDAQAAIATGTLIHPTTLAGFAPPTSLALRYRMRGMVTGLPVFWLSLTPDGTSAPVGATDIVQIGRPSIG